MNERTTTNPKVIEARRKNAIKRRRRKSIALTALILAVLTVFSVAIGLAIRAFGKTATETGGDHAKVMCSTNAAKAKSKCKKEIEPEEERPYTDRDVEMIAKTVWGESLVTNSDTQMSAVVWCILNRVDSDGYGCGNCIEYVLTFKNQFEGYDDDNPVTEHIEWLVEDVLERWCKEKSGEEDVGRTLPKDYMWFEGNGKFNLFRNAYDKDKADYYYWNMPSPYEN